MKRLTILVTALFAFIAAASAQDAPKGTSAIYLTTTAESLEEAHDIVMRTLIANDVDVRADNPAYFVTKSAGRPTRSGSDVTCTFACIEQDGVIVVRVTGSYKSPLDDFRSEDKVSKKGMSGSISMQVWDSMYTVALLIPHTDVHFVK